MRLVLLGAPGAGKGTQAERISKRLGVPAISTGNILREAVKNGTKTGLEAKKFMDAGELVPDDVMLDLIKERLSEDDCKNGFILDGFPRTIAQGEGLDRMGIDIDCAISFEVADEIIERRLSGRRVCSKCGAPYHIESNPPEKEGVCNLCGGELTQRADDNLQTIRNRLTVYHETTEPLKGFYEKKGKLKLVVAHDSIDATSEKTFALLGV